MKRNLLPIGLLALVAGCGEPSKTAMDEHAHHHHGPLVHRFQNAAEWAKDFDDPARDAWQKPAEVIAAMRLAEGMIVADVIPNPPRTRLVQDAESRGCTAIDGLAMLVNQGVIGIRLWTGRELEPWVMRAALEAVFGPGDPT